MGKTPSRVALLRVALQDLRAGSVLLVERLPALVAAATAPELRALLVEEQRKAGQQVDRLGALGVGGGPRNLWMGGILDDADRDATSHLPGEILDIALIGAVRKAKAAEIVSLTTAIVLARRDVPDAAAPLQQAQDEATATDRALATLLEAICPPATAEDHR